MISIDNEQYKSYIDPIIKKMGEGLDDIEKCEELGRLLMADPKLLGHLFSVMTFQLTELRIDNERHNQNGYAFRQLQYACNLNTQTVSEGMNNLNAEIRSLKSQLANVTQVKAVCSCGHLAGEHNGNGTCSHCDCKVFVSKEVQV